MEKEDINILSKQDRSLADKLKAVFFSWREINQSIEEAVKNAKDKGILQSMDVDAVLRNVLGPFFGDLNEEELSRLRDKVEVAKEDALGKKPISKNVPESDEGGELKQEKKIQLSDYEHFINYGEYPEEKE